MSDLLTIAEIAALMRVGRRTVAEDWVHRPGFPAPRYAPTRRTRLWAAADIERWATKPRSNVLGGVAVVDGVEDFDVGVAADAR